MTLKQANRETGRAENDCLINQRHQGRVQLIL